MSNKQLKILRNIRKYKHLSTILKKCGYTMDEYLEFQQNFPEGSLDYMIFSDRHFDENTTIMLTAKSESILDEDRRNSCSADFVCRICTYICRRICKVIFLLIRIN